MDYQTRELAIAISRLERNGKRATVETVMEYVAARPVQFPDLDPLDVADLWPKSMAERIERTTSVYL